MTSRRLVLAAADHLVTAICLAFWLTHRAKTVALAAIPPPLAKGLLGAAADASSTRCTPDFCAAAELDDHVLSTEHTPASPIARQEAARPRLSVFPGVGGLGSSGSEQIPLLVGRSGELQTGLRGRDIHIRRRRLDAKSLNSNLSLERRAA